MNPVGLTVIYATDLDPDAALDELLDWAHGCDAVGEGPGASFEVLKAYSFEAGLKLRWRERIKSAWRALRSSY